MPMNMAGLMQPTALTPQQASQLAASMGLAPTTMMLPPQLAQHMYANPQLMPFPFVYPNGMNMMQLGSMPMPNPATSVLLPSTQQSAANPQRAQYVITTIS